jgi:hypothetical protein
MFPIAKVELSFREISNYWSREINPPASSKELLHLLEAAWWLGELRGDSVHSRLQLLQKMFVSMCHRDDLGIIFLVGDSAGPLPIQLPNGSVKVDVRQQIRVPSSNIESWDESTCRDAFQALAETHSLDSYPELAVGLAWISLSHEEFATWLTKRGYPEPKFWQPRLKNLKRWKPRPSVRLTPHEEAVVSALNDLFPNGKLDHKAKKRDDLINLHLAKPGHLAKAGRSPVSSRVIQRTLAKIEFA